MGAPATEESPASPKRRRIDTGVEENKDPNAPGSATSGINAEQRARIEQSRLAALERKQQKADVSCSQDIGAEQRARIEQSRLAALERKKQKEQAQNQDMSSIVDTADEQRTRIEQNRLAALARKQQKADAEMAVQEKTCDTNDAESSSAPSTPSSESLLCEDESSPSDSSSVDSASSSSKSSSSSSDSSSDGSSDSDSESKKQSTPQMQLTPAQQAKIALNRRAAVARKNGITPEQFARMEANRRAALARKRGFDPEQIARMEENRRKAIERKQQNLKAAAGGPEIEADTSKVEADNDLLWNGVPRPKPVEERDARQKLVAQILCRWWFAMPPWPPESLDTDAEIARLGFRCVQMNTFDQEPELDQHGLHKAYELEQFKGCFRTSNGTLVDVRPKEGRPSYDQLMLKTTPDLYRLLIQAFEGQLMELFNEVQKAGCPAVQEQQERLLALRKQATEVRQKALFFLAFAPKKKGLAKS